MVHWVEYRYGKVSYNEQGNTNVIIHYKETPWDIGPLEEGWVHGQDRFKGCIFHKYLHFCWRGQTYEFTRFPFGLATAPPVFTKVIEASCGVHQEQVSAVSGIHRPVSAHASEETGSDRADSSNSRSELVWSSGIPGELFQVSSATIVGFMIDSSSGELSLPKEKVVQIESETIHLMDQDLISAIKTRSADRQNISGHSGSLSSPTSLQEPSGTQTQGDSSIWIQWNHKSIISTFKGGADLKG